MKGVRCHEYLDEHPSHDARPLIRDLRLHRVYPPLACPGSGHFKGNVCCPCLTTPHLPLRAPDDPEWFLHLPGLDSVAACNRSMCSIRHGHSKPEISCD